MNVVEEQKLMVLHPYTPANCVCVWVGYTYGLSVCPSMYPSICPKCSWFPVKELNFNDPILLKFVWYLTINRIQVEFEKEGYASVWPGVTDPD